MVKVSAPRTVREINYVDEIPFLENPSRCDVKKVLTTKLMSWKHEAEFRFLKRCSDPKQLIGEITAVYFGDPYAFTDNRERICDCSNSMVIFKKSCEQLKKSTKRDVAWRLVALEGNRVVVK